ncbi:nicotinate-nucleotide--dimethylbenzimidazole phosphoribosyltransferase [Aliibacillus thermotolerans]|uniref:Nicotinate-nucleotide--dimethylbenzimidazole phosphoribosyltransferase n=1 Tax=Aliibacillus thermotolerans TaxID=1834418 RepID=A0ABW0U6L5_9BACI|nr:nicotinate-nucleotide--dimethylbenzimidazole phosphoribosyltransferase [Aliibacillus thermotolerans]MDA3130889.1 nicotinate-nucleotide--dimethylbenzimidazole phosphoribosyltransferase [Aliibacillus thermotolerans]
MTFPNNFRIPTLDENVRKQAQEHIEQLTKPPGSLGRLESIASELAAMTGKLFPDVSRPGIIVFAADHGIVAEGVSAFPQELTTQMAMNFLNEGAAINVFAKQINAQFQLVDVGMKNTIDAENITNRAIKRGTNNFYVQDAMTKEEAMEALAVGYEEATNMIKTSNVNCLIFGEMGIGNTTASSAIVSLYSGANPLQVTGIGTGLSEEEVRKKANIIQEALRRRQPDKSDPIDVLSKVGGLELAAIAGAMLSAAHKRIPILVDGFISSAAAIIAKNIQPRCTDYMIIGHLSKEPGHSAAVQVLGKKPLIDLEMRLGEGTGAAVSYPILQFATAMMKEMATFKDLANYH